MTTTDEIIRKYSQKIESQINQAPDTIEFSKEYQVEVKSTWQNKNIDRPVIEFSIQPTEAIKDSYDRIIEMFRPS